MFEITLGHAAVAFIVAMSLPAAITGFIVWNFERKISARDRKRDEKEKVMREKAKEREEAREMLELCIVESNQAAIALAEATARAVQRIPDAHCNGDMHAALKYAAEVKHRQKEFLSKQGIKALIE